VHFSLGHASILICFCVEFEHLEEECKLEQVGFLANSQKVVHEICRKRRVCAKAVALRHGFSIAKCSTHRHTVCPCVCVRRRHKAHLNKFTFYLRHNERIRCIKIKNKVSKIPMLHLQTTECATLMPALARLIAVSSDPPTC